MQVAYSYQGGSLRLERRPTAILRVTDTSVCRLSNLLYLISVFTLARGRYLSRYIPPMIRDVEPLGRALHIRENNLTRLPPRDELRHCLALPPSLLYPRIPTTPRAVVHPSPREPLDVQCHVGRLVGCRIERRSPTPPPERGSSLAFAFRTAAGSRWGKGAGGGGNL